MVATHLISPERVAVRVRPVPPLEPPFDDERSPGAWWRETAGQLALDLPDVLARSVVNGRTGRSDVGGVAVGGMGSTGATRSRRTGGPGE